MKNKISVIIPVYNSEKTIIRTLDSILKQTYKNYEVIIVNDGSSDNSLNIINQFCEGKKNFLVKNIENNGVSNARNVGIDNSSGDYLVFLDSDDWVDNDYFENIINDINGFDLIVYSFRTNNNNSIKTIFYNENIDNSISKIEFCKLLTKYRLFANVTNKVFLREKVNTIRFDTSTNLGEDYEFVMHYFININNYKYINKSFYNYDLTTGNLGFGNKKNTYELKSKGIIRKLELYNMYNYNLSDVYNDFVKAFVIDMMYLMVYQNGTKVDMINNQLHCKKVFDLTKINVSLKNKILIYIFNSKSFIIVKFFSYLLAFLNFIIKKVKFGY